MAAENVRVADLEAVGAIRARSAIPEFYFQDTDQVDPAGQMRFRMDGDVLRLQRSTAAAWASAADVMEFNRATGAVTVAAAATFSGALSVAGVATLTGGAVLGADIYRTDNTSIFRIAGGSGNTAGGRVVLYGGAHTYANRAEIAAGTTLVARFDAGATALTGTLSVTGTSTLGGTISTSSTALRRDVNTSLTRVMGGTATSDGAYINLWGNSSASPGGLELVAGGSTGTLTFWTNNTERMRLNAAGHLGLGTTDIEAWSSSFTSVLEGPASAIGFQSTGIMRLFSNAYHDVGGYKHKTTQGATMLSLSRGTFELYVAPSGTADTAVSWTTALTIDNSGIATFGNAVILGGTTRPNSDGSYPLGTATWRWSAVYAVNGTIQTSARHLKDLHRNVAPVEAMDAIRSLPIYEFTYKNDEGVLRRFGPVLDEVPQWLRPNDDGETWVVGNLVAMNTLAIQATDDEVTRLRQRVAELEARLN